MSEFTSYFIRSSFLSGMASCIDLGATLLTYNYPGNTAEADGLAIRSDWETVAKDMFSALDAYQKEHDV
jgi:hypothetical protein